MIKQIPEWVETLGVPVVGLIVLGYGFWKVLSWVQGSLTGKIKYQTDIIIKLIDKITALQTDILKLDMLLRVRFGLRMDEDRITRKEDKK